MVTLGNATPYSPVTTLAADFDIEATTATVTSISAFADAPIYAVITAASNANYASNDPADYETILIGDKDGSNLTTITRAVEGTEQNWVTGDLIAAFFTATQWNAIKDHEANTTTAHGAVSAATASKLMIRDASGRARVADPDNVADIATKGYVDAGYRYLQTVRFTANGTFTQANYSGLRAVRVRVIGGGGGGGGATTTTSGGQSAGAGGGGGGYSEKFILISALGTNETVTIGAGGVGVSGDDGNTGGTTSFGSHLSATGGVGGTSGTDRTTQNSVVRQGGLGGLGSGGDLNAYTDAGQSSLEGSHVRIPGNGGGSLFGGGGRHFSSVNGTNGGVGLYYGGGGSGGSNGTGQSTARSGGDGANGIVIVEIYI